MLLNHYYYIIITIIIKWVQFDLLAISGEASPTFGHGNANIFVFIDRIRKQFLKK